MTGQRDHYDYSYGERRGFLRMHGTQGNERCGYWENGEFMHPNGIVSVYRDTKFTRFDFMFGDRMHTRQWERAWGDRTIPRLAREFVNDIYQGVIE